MRTRAPRLFAVLLIALSTGTCRRPNGVDDERLRRADGDTANWLMYGRTYDDHRFSPLSQINEQTIGKLGLVWTRELGTTRGLEATPLVENGVIYTTSAWSVVYALDARTGDVRWTYDPEVPRSKAFFICCDVVNRGVALYHGKVYVGTLEGRLIALDQRTGRPVWSVMTVDAAKAYEISGYPRIAKGMVLIGNSGSEYGVRGYITAYDAETGVQRWRTYTVPGNPADGFESPAMEHAAATWDGEWWKAGGGGTAWEGITYDPELDLLYFGTGNATAWYRALRNKSNKDNLYTASILAVHAGDGSLAWHFQTTPGDNWDYDATQPLVRADLTIGGRLRKVIMQANKNGFFYVLDRQTGEFLSGTHVCRWGQLGIRSGSKDRPPARNVVRLCRTRAGARLAGSERRAQLESDGIQSSERARLPRRAKQLHHRPRAGPDVAVRPEQRQPGESGNYEGPCSSNSAASAAGRRAARVGSGETAVRVARDTAFPGERRNPRDRRESRLSRTRRRHALPRTARPTAINSGSSMPAPASSVRRFHT